MIFTLGDAIAAATPLCMAAGWLVMRRRDRLADAARASAVSALDRAEIDKIGEIESQLATHLLDCARSNGRLEATVAGLQSDVNRVDRNVTQLQGEIRRLVSGPLLRKAGA